MSDEAAIRRANFRALAKTPAAAHAVLGGRYSYWRDLMETPTKSFGEKVARRIEEAYGIPRYALDVVGGEFSQPHQAKGSALTGLAGAVNYADPPLIGWGELVTADFEKPFRLTVQDGALGPLIYAGCIARFEPGRQPEPAWPVLVRDRHGDHYLRYYQAGAGGRWQAVATAPGYMALDSEADGLIIVAVMRGFDRP